MKKVLVSLMLASLLVVPLLAGAQVPEQPVTGGLPAQQDSVFIFINAIVNWALAILLIGAVLVIIFAAYLFLTAGGDADKVKTARQYILYALVAIIVGFLAKAIVMLVARILNISTTGIII